MAEAQLREVNLRLAGKVELFQFEALRSELSALEERVLGLEAGLSRVRLQTVPEQTHENGTAGEAAGEKRESEVSGEKSLMVDEDPREYTLEESAWDSLLVCGLATYAGESFMVVIGCLLNIVIQSIYCFVVGTYLAKPVITTNMLTDLAIWRVLFGHDVRNLDRLSGRTLAERACKGESFSITSYLQQELYQQLDTYPPMLCVIALFFWLMIVLSDMATTFDFTRALCSLPHARHSRIETSPDGGSISVEAISKQRLSLLLIGVVLPKLAIAGVMGVLGVTYLVYTKSAPDLLLNAMALRFVMDTDELLFAEIVPLRVRRVVAGVKPLTISSRIRPPRRFRRMPLRAMTLVTLAVLLVGVVWTTLLASELDVLSRATEILCKGNQDFVFTTDRSTGAVIAADLTRTDKHELTNSYLFRSVFMKTELDPAKTLDMAERSEVLYMSTGFDKLKEVESRSFQESADQRPCEDLVSSNLAYQEAFLEKFRARNCSQFYGTQCEVDIRPFCPESCGCDSPISGYLNRQGCSAQCDSSEESNFQSGLEFVRGNNACEDGANGSAGAYGSYFDEVQNQLLDERALVNIPGRDPGFIWSSRETFGRMYYDSLYEVFLAVTNMTLGKWARESFKGVRSQEKRDACGMVAFVYKVFKLDLCDTSGSSIFQGRVGSIRYLCLETCGFCGGEAAPYKETTWESLSEWASRALGETLFVNRTEPGRCSYFDQFPEVKSLLGRHIPCQGEISGR